MRVLVTRPREDAVRTAARLAEAGHDPVVAPLFAIRPTGAAIGTEGVAALLLTSGNAVRAIAPEHLAAMVPLPVFAVGAATGEAARAAGFTDVASAGGDAADLADFVRRRADPGAGALLHLSGAHVSDDFAESLGKPGFDLRRIVTYEAVADPALAGEALRVLSTRMPDAALIHSARAAGRFLEIFARLGGSPARPAIVAISARAAKAFVDEGGWRVDIAEAPHETAMLEALDRLRP